MTDRHLRRVSVAPGLVVEGSSGARMRSVGTTLQAFRNGEPQAVHAIYGRYRGPVYAVAATLVDTPEAAEEATAKAFEETWRAAAAFGSDRELSPWLLGFVVHGSRHAAPDGSATSSAPPRPDPAEFDAAWRLFETRRALDDLQPDERLVLELMYRDDASIEAVAAKIDAPTSAVEMIAGRAKHRLGAATSSLDQSRDTGGEPLSASIRPNTHELLGLASTWAQPSPAVDDAVLTRLADAVSSQPRLPSAPGPNDRRHLVVIAVVAALFLVAGLVIAVVAMATADDDARGADSPPGWEAMDGGEGG